MKTDVAHLLNNVQLLVLDFFGYMMKIYTNLPLVAIYVLLLLAEKKGKKTKKFKKFKGLNAQSAI